MHTLPLSFFSSLDLLLFVSVLFLIIMKKYSWMIVVYAGQSLVLSVLLVTLGVVKELPELYMTALLTVVVKVIIAPIFFSQMTKRYAARFAPAPYLNKSLSLSIILGIAVLAYSNTMRPLTELFSESPELIALGLLTLLSSLFFLLVRKDALSQIIAVLSFENAIVFIGSLMGIEQTIALELGITFDIAVWIIIATAFITVIYKQFGSLNVSDSMTQLKE